MDCPHCSSNNVVKRDKLTKLGYQIFFCNNCNRQYNERTLSPFNRLKAKTEIVFEVVILRLRFKLSLRDLVEMFLIRGITLSHETIRTWEQDFAPFITEYLRAKRRTSTTDKSWYCDETKIKIGKHWYYLYRAIDKFGRLVDIRLSKSRSSQTTTAFFEKAVETTGVVPEKVTTDKEVSYPGAIKEVLGRKVEHRTNKYLNNGIEQDHRGIKQRYYPMQSFKNLFEK
jgi:putative transposase